MKKLILGMMLVTASLSFSNDRDRGKDSPNFEELKLRAEISYEQKEKNDLKKTNKKSRSIIPNIFDDYKSLNDNNYISVKNQKTVD